MLPTVFGPIHTYGLMLAIGFYAGWLLAMWRARKEGVEGRHISDLLIYTVISGIIGARLLYVITEWQSFESVWDMFKIWQGGLVFYGGMATGTATLITVLVRRKLSIRKIADILAPSIALGLIFGRIGCLAYGCCWGDVAPPHYPLAVQFPGKFVAMVNKDTGEIECVPDGSPAFVQHVQKGLIAVPKTPGVSASLPVYPTQLFESFDSLIICLLLSLLYRYRKRYGEVFLLFGFLYSVQRFILEMIRADNQVSEVLARVRITQRFLLEMIGAGSSPYVFNLTISQAVSLVFGAACVIMFVHSRLLPANVVTASAGGGGRLEPRKKPAAAKG